MTGSVYQKSIARGIQPFHHFISQLAADEAIVFAPQHQHGSVKLACARLKVFLARAEVMEVRQKGLLSAFARAIGRELSAYLSRDGVAQFGIANFDAFLFQPKGLGKQQATLSRNLVRVS